MIVSVGHRAAGIPPGMVFGIGVFDGLHLGHQAIIARLRQEAAARREPSAILTFDPHPLSVVGTPPLPLFTDDERHELLVQAGIDHLVCQPFDRVFARLSPDRFTGEVLGGSLRPSLVVVGHDFRYGGGGAGDTASLAEAGRRLGFGTVVVNEVTVGGEPVHSSRIRDLVASGEVGSAAGLLGRPFHVTGRVIAGKGIGGRRLGFPTLNIAPPPKLIPPAGVYAGAVLLDGTVRPAAVNIGLPSEDAAGVVEAHLLDFAGDLYGRDVRILFHERLREERRFPDQASLAQAIAADVAEVRRRTATRGSR